MSKNIISNDWFQRFFSYGNNIGSGRIIDPREAALYFEDIQNQMNFMFVLLHAISIPNKTELTGEHTDGREARAPELGHFPRYQSH